MPSLPHRTAPPNGAKGRQSATSLRSCRIDTVAGLHQPTERDKKQVYAAQQQQPASPLRVVHDKTIHLTVRLIQHFGGEARGIPLVGLILHAAQQAGTQPKKQPNYCLLYTYPSPR